ncbi:gp8 [Enterobacter hormaechei]|nr:gp8 [Enterobacter hormaechei]
MSNYAEEGRELALLCVAGTYAKDDPIKLGSNGQFTKATADTDSVIGYSQDDATIAASTTDFIRVRMRVGTVAAADAGA